jgi:7-keto-8-aminopelargonate synthetase-like enzyme
MISVFAATVATAALIVSGVGAQSQCNTVRNSQKQDCHLFSQSTCQAAGCCWGACAAESNQFAVVFSSSDAFCFSSCLSGHAPSFEAALDLLRTNMLANVDIAGKVVYWHHLIPMFIKEGQLFFFLKKTIPYCRAKTNFVV